MTYSLQLWMMKSNLPLSKEICSVCTFLCFWKQISLIFVCILNESTLSNLKNIANGFCSFLVAFASHPIMSFSWHPTQENRMLTISQNNQLLDYTVFDRITLVWFFYWKISFILFRKIRYFVCKKVYLTINFSTLFLAFHINTNPYWLRKEGEEEIYSVAWSKNFLEKFRYFYVNRELVRNNQMLFLS